MATVCVDHPASFNDASNRLIDKMNQRISASDKFFSLEFFPPRTASGACNLFEKCNRLSQGAPLFCDVSCDVSKTDSVDEHRFIDVASTTQDITQVDTAIQLNSSQVTEDAVLEILYKARRLGLSNIMAVSDSKSCLFSVIYHEILQPPAP